LIELKGKQNIVYSFFKLDQYPSVSAYCIELERDMLDI